MTRLRSRVGEELFSRVAGPNGQEARKLVHETPGPRWFPKGSEIRRVHGDASMWVGGLRALLLQSLHPLAMAGVAGHSGYRGDPWGRLERTSTFLAFTTFGTADDAQALIDRIRAIHERVRGKAPDGRAYRASDPHLLTWVHIAEADSFLRAHQRYGARPLDAKGADAYLAQSARVTVALGGTDVPTTVAELAEAFERYRPELGSTEAARDTARFLLKEPPLPWLARGPYSFMTAGAISLLPTWVKEELEIDSLWSRWTGEQRGALVTKAVRWGLSSALPDYPTL